MEENKVVKKILLIVIVLGLLLVSVLGCTSQGEKTGNNVIGLTSTGGAALAAANDGNAQSSGVWVTGEGKVTVTPDLILLTLGVEAQEPTVTAAQDKVVTAMDAIKKLLLEQGIVEKDIQTQYFNIGRVTHWLPEENREEVTGYRVSNIVTVKVRQLDKAGAIIDAVTAAAGDLTRIDGISFTVEDPAPYYNQAREKAIQDAIAKANQVATLVDITLDKPTYISVSGNNYPSPIRMYDSYSKEATGAPMPTPMPTTSISPGELEIQTTVTVVFGIK